MEQQQESQQKASRKRSSSASRKYPVREEGEVGGDRHHPHNETPMVIKAPDQDTSIEVPDPDEDGDVLRLQSNKGVIDFLHFSPYEENLETKNPHVEAQPSIPETARANENASVSPKTMEIRERIGEADASPRQELWNEFFKIMTDDNADGYTLPPDTDTSLEAVSELWAECIQNFVFFPFLHYMLLHMWVHYYVPATAEHLFNFLNDLQIDTLPDYRTPAAQPPQSATVMPSASDTITESDWYRWESWCDDYTTASTSTPQDQTLPPISTAMPSVLNTIADTDKYNLEMIDRDNPIAGMSTPQAPTPPPINTATPFIPNTIADIGWSSRKIIHDDNATPSISTAQAQPQPPIDTTMPSGPNMIANNGWDSFKMINQDDVTASINESQAQTQPQLKTAMPSVPKALPDMGWDSMEMTHEDNAMANISASQAQTPPPVNTPMPYVSNMIADADRDSLNIIHEDNTMTSTNTTQPQITQPSATEKFHVSKTTGSKSESVMRSMAKVNPNSEKAEVTPVARERGPILKVYKRRAKLSRPK